ncbi:MAG TPA: hypothetical protein ENH85_10965 [Candidatus Scalindua sp.]|nr:hypothetical protein [Candidatus Scalindua sp.]
MSEQEMKRTDELYNAFKEHFSKGSCYKCGSSLKAFSSKKPCIHWFLRPKDFKKKHFKSLFGLYGYFQMEAFARWVANQDDPVTNINDLDMEKSEKKIIETTIKYKHIEWSFSCSNSDIEGHVNSQQGNFPHFHFQMRLDNKPFINYKDFHIPLKDEDIWKLAMINQTEIPIEHHFRYGEGMQSALSDDTLEFLIDNSEKAENESEATYKFNTIVTAKQGQTISGDDIADLIEESKRTGTPFAKLAHRLVANVQTIVKAGDAVPELAKRTSTKKNK